MPNITGALKSVFDVVVPYDGLPYDPDCPELSTRNTPGFLDPSLQLNLNSIPQPLLLCVHPLMGCNQLRRHLSL